MLNNDIQSKSIIFQDIINESVSEDGEQRPDKIAQFKSLLDANKSLIKEKAFNSFELLCLCLDKGATEIANILIDAGANLSTTAETQDILQAACGIGSVNIYEKAEKNIKDNPKKYKKMNNKLKKGDCFYTYLTNAILFGQIDIIELLLKKYQPFFQENDFDYKSPVNILFITGNALDNDTFNKIYHIMLNMGYQDINPHRLDNEKLTQLFKRLIKNKDKEHLIQLLQQGIDVSLVDKNYQSPQDLIKSDHHVDEVAIALLNKELNDNNVNINDIHEKLIHLLSQRSETPEIVEQFKKLLHTGNDCFMIHNYKENSAQLLKICIDRNQPILARILIEANAHLHYQGRSLLDACAEEGRSDIYNIIREKVINYPDTSPEISKELKSGKNLHKYLLNAIGYGNSDFEFIKMLLNQNLKFYQQHDAHELSPVNMLFEEGGGLKEKIFEDLYHSMIDLGFQDLNFDVPQRNLEKMAKSMIKRKDIDNLIKMLAQGKDLSYVNQDYLSPQELIKTGVPVNQVAKDLLTKVFAYDKNKILPFDIMHLHPNEYQYSDEALSEFSAGQKADLKKKLIALLPTIALGNTKLDPEVESQLYEKILIFLNKNEPLYLKNLDRVDATLQLLRMFRNPEYLGQGAHNLCGVAAFSQILIDTNPLELIDEMIAFCETGKTNNPYFFSKTEKIKKELNIFEAFIQAYKNNHSTYGYHQCHEVVESITGGTKSKSIVNWMEAFGFKDIIDTWILTDPKNKEISKLHRNFLGGLYSKHHKSFKKSESRFTELLNAYQEGKSIALCIGPTLTVKGKTCNDFMQNASLKERQEFKTPFTIMGIYYTHWVYLNEIQYDEIKNEVTLKYATFGDLIECTLSKENFLSEFFGMVAGKAPATLDIKGKPKPPKILL